MSHINTGVVAHISNTPNGKAFMLEGDGTSYLVEDTAILRGVRAGDTLTFATEMPAPNISVQVSSVLAVFPKWENVALTK